jgi:hypothetical protein
MQQLPTFNFGLTKNFFFIYRTLSMRQKTKNYRIRGSNAQKNFFFILFSKSHTHMGLVCAKNASEKFSRLGTFKGTMSQDGYFCGRSGHFNQYFAVLCMR